jgi:hypothetical protein
MKAMFLLSLLSVIIFSCNTTKLAVNNTNNAELTSSNDTIYFQKQPIATVEHYGWVIDNHNNYAQKIVLKDISCCDDHTLEVISFVKHKHHDALIEYRNK